MQWRALTTIAILFLAAACQTQPQAALGDRYVPHGRFPTAIPLDQAVHDCRLQLESAARRTSPAPADGRPRQIPTPFASQPEYASMEACMEAKGYRRAD